MKTTEKQAQNNFNAASITTTDFEVTSKMDGKVYALFKEPGEIITSMEPIATIGSANRFVIKLLVDEVDIVRIHIKQEVLIDLEAYADTILKRKYPKFIQKKMNVTKRLHLKLFF